MRSYETARSLFGFFGFLAWVVIILGAIAALGGGAATQAIGRNAGPIQFLLGATPGILMALAGVFGLAMVQMGRTGVDGAEYAQQALDVARQQLEVSRQILARDTTQAASYSAAPAVKTPAPNATIEEAAASYANQPNAAPQPASRPATTQIAKPATETSAPAQISRPQQAALPPPHSEIVYKDGKFIVGEKKFWSKDEAIDHQKELLSIAGR